VAEVKNPPARFVVSGLQDGFTGAEEFPLEVLLAFLLYCPDRLRRATLYSTVWTSS
jgi:hypothetical protein